MALSGFFVPYNVTIIQVMRVNDIPRSTLQDWEKTKPELLKSIAIGTRVRLDAEG